MAYVLLNTKIGYENNTLEEIRKIEGVKEAFSLLWGVYDIIAASSARHDGESLTNINNN
jgi:hypothetical protein